eukprot:TsM_000375000 transcript=TsM_000375000 gene=TsM_000375000
MPQSFNHYRCSCSGTPCNWLIHLDQVMPHLLQCHKTLRCEEVVFMATDFASPGGVDWAMMQSFSGHFFILMPDKQKRSSPNQVFFTLVLLIEIKTGRPVHVQTCHHNSNRSL